MSANVAVLCKTWEEQERVRAELLAAGYEVCDLDGPIPEPPKIPVTRPGDLWTLGEHRLLCGDCRAPADVARLTAGRPVNVAFTSPPYASQRKYDESSGFRPIRPDEYVAWFEAVQASVRSVLTADGSWFVNIKEHTEDGQRSLYVKDLAIAHVRAWKWRLVDELVWVHHGFPGRWPDRFKNGFEPVFHFAVGPPKFRPDAVSHLGSARVYEPGSRMAMGSGGYTGSVEPRREPGLVLPSNVIRVSSGGSGGHSAAFPVGLPTFFVLSYSDPGDAVFDPFVGSGTTIIACEKTGRRGLGTEISPAYCDVAVARWQALTGKAAVLESSSKTFRATAKSRGVKCSI